MSNLITPENLEQQLKAFTPLVLKLARDHCWNKISDTVKYVIKRVPSELNESGKLLDELDYLRKKLLSSKEPQDLKSTVEQLKSYFSEILRIHLYVFKAKKNLTIIEVEVIENELSDTAYLQYVEVGKPQIFSYIISPPYTSQYEHRKFDVNWRLGTFDHKWMMFWGRRKLNRKLKEIGKFKKRQL